MGGIFKTLTSATGELETTAGKMNTIADQTARQAKTVLGAATEASSNVQTVAAAAEELAASISEISRQVGDASTVAAEAVQIVQGANGSMKELASNAQKIGDVVSLITEIARADQSSRAQRDDRRPRAPGDAEQGLLRRRFRK